MYPQQPYPPQQYPAQPSYPPPYPPQQPAQPGYQQPQYQQPQYPPQAPQQPQQPPQQPAQWQGTGDPFGAQKRPSISWGTLQQPVPHGTRRWLLVYQAPEVIQKRDFDTQQLEFWPDTGAPVWQVVTGVIDENGEDRGLFCGRPSAMAAAIQVAQEAAGSNVEPGGILDVTYTHDKPDPAKPRMTPAKQFAVVYVPPAQAATMMTPAQQQAWEGKRRTSPAGQTFGPPPAQQGPPQQPQASAQQGPPQQPQYGPPQGQQAPQGPPAAPPQYGPPQGQQGPPQGPPPQQAGPDLQGFTVAQLTALRGLEDNQLVALGQDVAKVRYVANVAQAAGLLPPF